MNLTVDQDDLYNSTVVPLQPAPPCPDHQDDTTALDTQFLLRDCLSLLRVAWDANDQVDGKQFVHKYFEDVACLRHVFGRPFDFVFHGSHNRLAFVHELRGRFAPAHFAGRLLSLEDFHQVVMLICPDFPFALLHFLGKILWHGNTEEPPTRNDRAFSFQDLSTATGLFVFYFEFWCWLLDAAMKSNLILSSIPSPQDIADSGIVHHDQFSATFVCANGDARESSSTSFFTSWHLNQKYSPPVLDAILDVLYSSSKRIEELPPHRLVTRVAVDPTPTHCTASPTNECANLSTRTGGHVVFALLKHNLHGASLADVLHVRARRHRPLFPKTSSTEL